MTADNELRRVLSTPALFALGFGHIVGIGWITILGKWLGDAGPGGSIAAVVVAGLGLCCVGLCYGAVAERIPRAGAEVAYAHECIGERAAYGIGWIIAFYAICVVAFLAISFAMVFRQLFPAIGVEVVYSALGKDVSRVALAAAVAGCTILTVANALGMKLVFRLQTVLTASLIVAGGIIFLASILRGRVEHALPLFPEVAPVGGFFAVLVLLPFFYGGFQLIPQMLEERKDTVSASAGTVIIAAILGALVFYAAIVWAVSTVVPWQSIVGAELATHAAVREGIGPAFGVLVLLAGLLGILTSWNSAFVWGVRAVFALGRAYLIAPTFGRLRGGAGTPLAAVMLVGGVSLALSAMGPGVLVPLVGTASALISFTMLVTCYCAWRLHGTTDDRGRTTAVAGGRPIIVAGMLVSTFLVVYSLVQPFIAVNRAGEDAAGALELAGLRLPLESLVLVGWLLGGALLYASTRRQRSAIPRARRRALLLGQDAGVADAVVEVSRN